MEQTFNSTLDKYSKTVTLVFGFLLIAILASLFYKSLGDSTSSSHFLNIILIFVIIILVSVAASFYPKRIILNENTVLIEKMIGTTAIPFSSINSISAVSGYPVAMTISTKGFLGYLGITMDGGKSYVTNANNAVLIKTMNNKGYIISLENRDVFIKAVSAHLK